MAKYILEKEWQPTPVFLHEKSHGQRSLVGYSPWACKESDMTERLNNKVGVITPFIADQVTESQRGNETC